MGKEMLALVKFKDGDDRLSKFMRWMQLDEGLAERSKSAILARTIGTVTPDKSTVMFKVFITDKAGMMDFVSGKNSAIKPSYDECIESIQLWDLSEVEL